jgi:hypothetical protein
MDGEADGGGFALPELALTEPLPQPASQIIPKARENPRTARADFFHAPAFPALTDEFGMEVSLVPVRFFRRLTVSRRIPEGSQFRIPPGALSTLCSAFKDNSRRYSNHLPNRTVLDQRLFL